MLIDTLAIGVPVRVGWAGKDLPNISPTSPLAALDRTELRDVTSAHSNRDCLPCLRLPYQFTGALPELTQPRV